ncbi:hypothetical protein BC962_1343 [Gillisia mitskevichiae]|uniref:Uncharacterized protein n=1 Tax=Gillisia mitskevichiae TaxID=270921 RepID=A0A495PSB9_9FLAO|nr:hypothetical protein [Gillisia mitskevichiae]RKS53097.1 hypothetical protein BC962_1343 [Gillisia mitskevichiae]
MNVIVKRAIVGGVVSTIIMGIGTYILGEMSGYKAKELLSTSLSGINMLCNTVILGSSTILALMLPLLSLSTGSNSRLTKVHYSHVLTIAKFVTILIIVSVITFLMLNLPITESEEVPSSWFTIIYYISLGMASILGGGFIAIVTMLYETISNVILIVGFGVKDHPMVEKAEDQAEEAKENAKENKERIEDE